MRLFNYWPPIAAATTAILALPALGMLADSACRPISNTLCEIWSNFQWETVLAGSLGLVGGIFVLVSTRQQISAQKKAAVALELIDIDALIAELETHLVNVSKAVQQYGYSVRENDPQSASTANEEIHRVSIELEDKLLFEITGKNRLPAALRKAAYDAHQKINQVTSYKFGVTVAHTDYTSISETQFGLQEWEHDAGKRLENLKFHRKKYADFLMER